MAIDEDRVAIETPEHVAVSYELAGIGSRVVAMFVDVVIQAAGLAVISLVLLWLSPVLERIIPGASLTGWILLASGMLIHIGYFIVFEIIWNGQTPGKRMTGIRVVRTNGTPIRAVDSFIRNIIRLVDLLPGFYSFGLISLFATKRMQRLGDLAAGTMVVKERTWDLADQPTESLTPSPPGATAAPTIRATGRLDANELAAVERFIERREELDPATRTRLAAQIANSLSPRFPHLPPDQTADAETFIEAIYRAYLTGPHRS